MVIVCGHAEEGDELSKHVTYLRGGRRNARQGGKSREGNGTRRHVVGESTAWELLPIAHVHVHVYMRKGFGIFLENCKKNRQPPRIEPGPLTLAVSALPPELWPPGDSQPSQFSISLRMYMYYTGYLCTRTVLDMSVGSLTLH